MFVPRFYPDRDTPEIVDGADSDRQEQWLDRVYSDESLVTQRALAPGTTDLAMKLGAGNLASM